MHKTIIILLLFLFSVAYSQETPKKRADIKYYGREHFLIEGTAIPEAEKENPYDRLPASYKEKVRKPVWELSKNSSGISLRFMSNSSSVRVKWTLMKDTKLPHMAETGIKGVDLYCKLNGKWRYMNTGQAKAGLKNEASLANGLNPAMREFKIYLPLYDGVTNIEIGIDSLSTIEKPAADTKLPIVFYGTSITQGACASRPGMAYPSIVSRKMGVDCINLGFSGNGKMETPLSELLAGTKASFYVIDCLANMTNEEVRDSVAALAKNIRAAQPNTPIVFVEMSEFPIGSFVDRLKGSVQARNKILHDEYEKLKKGGMKNLFYIDNKFDPTDDGETTVDGQHMTDLGFMRFSDYLVKNFKRNNLKIIE